jgi:hypothetical protein
MIAVRYFLRINGKDFKCDKADMVGFHKRSYTLQSRVYGTLEAMDTSVLREDTNEFYDACRIFIEQHLTDLD